MSRPSACANSSPTCPRIGSTASIDHPASPIAANENRWSLGGARRARARLSEPRSGPYQGLARAPFTGLRVVATRSVGLAESREASKRVPAATLPQPASASAAADDASARRSARREAAAYGLVGSITPAPWNFFRMEPTAPCSASRLNAATTRQSTGIRKVLKAVEKYLSPQDGALCLLPDGRASVRTADKR